MMELLNKTKKGLVYDNQKYFSRFLKYEFEREFDFKVCRNFDYFDGKLSDYSVIIFVIYEEEELFDFLQVYQKGIPLIICTFNKQILNKLKKTHKKGSNYLKCETIVVIYLKKGWSIARLCEKTVPDPILSYFPLNFASFHKDTRMQKFKVNLQNLFL